MEELLEMILQALRDAGIRARAAMSAGPMPRLKAPMTAVRMERVKMAEQGMGRYLGQEDDPETGLRPIYGRGLEATVLFRVTSPAEAGGEGCFREVNRLLDALLAGMDGVSIGECTQEECRYERDTDQFTCAVRAEIRARMFLRPAADSEPAVADVVVRGVAE